MEKVKSLETQIKILIESEDDFEKKELLRSYYEVSKTNNNFNEEKYLDDILQCRFSLLN